MVVKQPSDTEPPVIDPSLATAFYQKWNEISTSPQSKDNVLKAAEEVMKLHMQSKNSPNQPLYEHQCTRYVYDDNAIAWSPIRGASPHRRKER